MAETESREDPLVKDVTDTLDNLKEIRRPFETQIDDILTYLYHGRRRIKDTDTNKGQKTGDKIYDGTALGALNLLADGLTGYTVSKGFKWFGYTLPQRLDDGRRLDSVYEVKRWLEEVEEVMYAAFLASNLYDLATEFVRDAASVGTVTINADEDVAKGRTIFSVPHFRECYLAEDYFGRVDTNIRVRDLTLKQMVEKFGWKQMVEAYPSFRQDYEKNRNSKKEIIHARFPRRDFDPKRMDGKNKPFASIWVLTESKKLLLDSGTDIQNFVTWRWRKNSDEWYGRSPAWDAFVDHMTANQIAKTNLTAAHKMVDGPMVGPDDLRGKVQRNPGGWTSVDDMTRVPKPLQENIQLPFSLDMQNRYREMVKEHFHVDFFLMLSQAAMQRVELTATQVIEMGGEKAAVLGPRIGRMETEALGPIHDIVFAIERRAGRIPNPPDILMDFGGAKIEIEYLGPLAQAQRKLFRSQGIQQGMDAAAPIIQMFPETMDAIDGDKTVRDLLMSRGFPQKDLRDEDQVKNIRQVRQAEREKQQQLAEAISMAKAMPAAGKEISPKSAAGMLMNMEGGQ